MDDKAARQRKYEKWKQEYYKRLSEPEIKKETEFAREARLSREKAEKHRELYARFTQEQLVNACIELEGRALHWQKLAYQSKNEIGRLRKVVRTMMGIVNPRSKKDVLRADD